MGFFSLVGISHQKPISGLNDGFIICKRQPNADNTNCECRPQFTEDGSGNCVCPPGMSLDQYLNCAMQPIHCPPLEQPNTDNTGCECRPEYPYSDDFGKCACPEPNQMLDAHLNCVTMPLPCGYLHEPNSDQGFKYIQRFSPIQISFAYFDTFLQKGKKLIEIFRIGNILTLL